MTSTQIKNAMKRTISVNSLINNANKDKVYFIGTSSSNSYYKLMLRSSEWYIEIEILGNKIATIRSSNVNDDKSFKCALISKGDSADDTNLADNDNALYIQGIYGDVSLDALVTFDSYRALGTISNENITLKEYNFNTYYVEVDFVTDSVTTTNQSVENLEVHNDIKVNKLKLGNWLDLEVSNDGNEIIVTYPNNSEGE